MQTFKAQEEAQEEIQEEIQEEAQEEAQEEIQEEAQGEAQGETQTIRGQVQISMMSFCCPLILIFMATSKPHKKQGANI